MYSCININVNTLVWFVEAKNQFPNFVFNVGLPFTWCNNCPIGIVWEKIDWAVATNEWFSLFPGTRVFHLDNSISDHISIWIVLAEL